jgi:plastocyanin
MYNRAASMALRPLAARAALIVPLLAAPAVLRAGAITGKVELVDKGGRKATDLSDVVVYVDGARVKPKPATATMVMKGKAFNPRVVVVPVGGTVQFPNEDPIFHNAFSVSGDNRFDMELYKRPKVGAFTFQHPGIVKVYCNIHPQMSAVVLVRDNPLFTKAAVDGSFTIENVPAGKYVVKAWHERGGEAGKEVTVTDAGTVQARFTLDGSTYKSVPHKNKFGKDYSTDEKY